MVEMMIFSRYGEEIPKVREVSRDLAARLTEENWDFHCFNTQKEAEAFVRSNLPLDIVCTDVTGEDGIGLAKECRRRNRNAYVILIADIHLSPASYMKPSIMAGSLLLRPFRTEEITEAFSEAFGNFFKEDEENEEENQFIIDNREGKWRIDLEHVYYFEAREKKLFLNDGVREIGFYDTLDNIRKKLPAWFVRCHRSFLINGRKIEKLLLGQNLVVLKDGWEIPVSRTYKKEIKEYVG